MINEQRRWLVSGGIGSGKSAVRALLERFGFETIDSDSIGHDVLEPGRPAFDEVARRWPATVVDGLIDRALLAKVVFTDQQELTALEGITHPYIFDTIGRLVQGIDGVVVVEIPLIRPEMEGSWRRIVVDCSDATRLERLLERKMTSVDAQARMRSQPTRSNWLAAADLVVPNHGSQEELASTVEQLSHQL